jgi:glycosyltransferase involved in cell wall biosynthesis
MIVSVETPVFKGGWLRRCIDSVLYQNCPNWRLSLLWDGGDEQSRQILKEIQGRNHPNVTVHFAENQGISRSRRFLSEHSEGDFILPLDDDDLLPFNAVERMLVAAESRPWASVIRGHRKFIDESGRVVDMPPWFPYEARHYQDGMVTDPFNHSQPYLIRRSAYERTSGWEGFEDFSYAGEDCDIYLKLEEQGSIELLDEMLYYYRIHGNRASLVLTDEAAFEMWRRLADKTITRIGLPLRRTNEKIPFVYERLERAAPTIADVDFVVVEKGDRSSKLQGNRVAGALKRGGIGDDAIFRLTHEGSGYLNEAFEKTTRAMVCLVDADLEIDEIEEIEALLELMATTGADLAAPKLVTEDGFIVSADPGFTVDRLPEMGGGPWDEGQSDGSTDALWLPEKFVMIRREVIRAVGGADPGYESERVAMVDFCLKARQREFKCVYEGRAGFEIRASDERLDAEGDLARLHRKWAGYPLLFMRDSD